MYTTMYTIPQKVFRLVVLAALFQFLFLGNLFAGADMQPTVFEDSMDPVPANGIFEYHVELKNHMENDATDTELNITIPATFSYISTNFSSECSYTGTTPSAGAANDRVVCDFGTFAGYRTEDIYITLQAGKSTGVYQGDATVDSDIEENSANNTELVKTTIVESADLNLSKRSLINPIAAGGIETYEFTVHNRGPFRASKVRVIDTLPTGLMFHSNGAGGWSCSNEGQKVTCAGPNMDVNETSIFRFKVKVVSDTIGTIINSAEVSSKEPDANTSDNVDTDDLTVTEGTDVSISKQITTSPAIEEQNLTFVLTVKNEGPMTAQSVRVRDTLPSGYTDIAVIAADWNCSVSDTNVTCIRDDANMSANTTEIITIKAKAPTVAGAAESHSNYADVNTTTDDPVPENDSAMVPYTLFADQADLKIEKSKIPTPPGKDTDTPVAKGYELNSTIVVTNKGPREATPVQVIDLLDVNESFVSFSGTHWSCTSDGNVSGEKVTCDYSETLSNGEKAAVLTVITKADEADDDMRNEVCTGGSKGSAEPDATDEVTSNNCADSGVEATAKTADIRVFKSTSDTVIDNSENNFTYTIIVENSGTNTAEDVEFVDNVPQYVAEYNGRPATGLSVTTDKAGASCGIADGKVTCDLQDILKDERVEVNITVSRPMREGSNTNTAYAFSKETGDTNRSNNEDSVDVTVSDIAEIELVEKKVTYANSGDPILAGTEATYTIQVRNNGPALAKDVNVTDVFDGEAFTFISASSAGNSCSYDEGTRTVMCQMGDIADKSVESITVVVMPDHNATVSGAWEINNTASVTMSTPDSNSSNNEKNATLEVRLGELDISVEINESPDFYEPVAFDPDHNESNMIVYEVIVQNLGPSLATDINFTSIVNRVFPENNQTLQFLRDTNNSNGSDDGTSICTSPIPNPFKVKSSAPGISCILNRLEVGDEYKRYLVFHVDNSPHLVSGDVYHVEVSATVRETELQYGNNVEDERTTVRVKTDPGIIKTGPGSSVDVGEDFNYTLNIINHGPGYSPDTIVEDTLPANMVLTGTPATTQGTCTGSSGSTSFSCDLDAADGTLHSKQNDPGGVWEVNIAVPVKFTDYPGDMRDDQNSTTVTNRATVSTTGPDTNSSNNESNATVTVNKPAIIGDRLWLDRDADGEQDLSGAPDWKPTEPGIANHPVYLILERNGSVIQRGSTNAEGWYGFKLNHVDPLGYRIRFDLPPHTRMTAKDAYSKDGLDSDFNASGVTDVIEVHYGDHNMSIDGGIYTPVNIGDRVWIDENGDGRQTAGEANVPGVKVRLYWDVNDSQVIHDLNGTVFGTGGVIATDVDGKYLFTNLKPAKYYVVFDKTTLPSSEYVFTTRNVGSSSKDSDASRSSGETEHKTIKSDKDITKIYTYPRFDAGIYIPVSIGDYVWHDQNGNGQQDSSEANLSDINVTLWRSADNIQVKLEQDGTPIGADGLISTENNGSYLFKNLKPDSYYVKFETPIGYVVTLEDAAGSSESNDSDLNASTGRTIDYILTSDEDNRSVDAGYYVEIKLGDCVWEDSNYNGIQDAGEANVSGVTVELIRDGVATGTIQSTTATGYLFEHLSPNHTYSVKFSDLPAGYRFTLQDVVGSDDSDSDANATGYASGHTPKVLSNDVNLSFDAGIYKPVVIGDYVWEDKDADGIQESGEKGISGVLVTLIKGGTLQPDINTTTDANGYYEFNTSFDLKPDHNYSVEFGVPAGYFFTTQNAGSNDGKDSDANATGGGVAATPTMYSGDENRTLDAGMHQLASIGNRIWLDRDADGVQDAGENNLAGVSVDVALYTALGIQVGSTQTVTNGSYLFTGIVPGNYYVEFTLPGGYRLSPNGTAGEALDSDVNVSLRTATTLLTSGENDLDWDMGVYQLGSWSGTVTEDRNNNSAINDSHDTPIADVNITLYADDNNDGVHDAGETTVAGSVLTDADGDYNITHIRPGNYVAVEIQPAGYVDVAEDEGGADDDKGDNSVVNAIAGTIYSGEDDANNDFVEEVLGSIGNRIWLDTNADGVQNSTEENVTVSITVELLDESNATVDTQTVGDGNYLFANVRPGSYHLRFTLPSGYLVSSQDVTLYGADDNNDSDVNATTLETTTTILSSGENDMRWDMGIYQPAAIGDRIWLDRNGDGVQESDESNFTGSVTVYLEDENNASVTDASGNPVGAVTTTNGAYAFSNLIPGTYHLQFDFPAESQVSPRNKSTADKDSDVRLDSNTTVNTLLISGENDKTWDVGLFNHAGLGNQIWIDTNGNNIQDAGDTQTLDVDVTVNLYYDGNKSLAGSQIVKAESDGRYSFKDVDPNDYYVEFILPADSGYKFVVPHTGDDDKVDSDVDPVSGRTPAEKIVSNELNNTLDAGIYIPASIGDRVWLDVNANGVQDAGEGNISDINVTLYDDVNNSVDTTVTDENGSYRFSGLVPGDYRVVFALTDNSGQHYVVSPKDVATGAGENSDSDINATGVAPLETLISGEQNPTYDAGLYSLVSIGDFVWSDENGNGVQDAGEPGISDVNVTLFREEASGSVTTIGSQVTSASGRYLFRDLVPGYYYVDFDQPEHFRPTGLNSGSSDAADSDADPITGKTAVFELFSPDDNLTLDAGFYALGTILGNVSEDTDNDEKGDVNLQGVILTLVNSAGMTVATTTTDANGDYSFNDVEPGSYTVVETQPVGLVNVSENEGGADDDAGDTTQNNSITVVLNIGERDSGNDFVEEGGVTIGDRVWNDENGNGLQDATETKTAELEGIVVNLYNERNDLIATTITDSDGEYLFENYPEDTYYVAFDLTTLPEHYGVTQQNRGSDDIKDSDPLIATGITASDYLAPGEDNRTFDMGIYLLGTISGLVLEDTNDDDIGDTPMGGVTIILYDESGTEVGRTVTEADGSYSFTDLHQGVYTIVELQPSGYLTVDEAEGDLPHDGSLNSITVTLDAGEHDGGNDYIEEIGGSLGNYVWFDSNGDGLQSADETGVNGITVCLEDSKGNPLLDADGAKRCTDTNATGYYLFEGILPGEYAVVFEIPTGTTLTPFPQEGSDGAVDSDPLETTGDTASASVTMELGDDILTIDMGLVYLNTASIGDFVWLDEDEDGIFDSGETGLDGVTVNLYSEDGVLLESIVTHDGGAYLFEHLAAGAYMVEFDVPNDSGYEFTRASIGAVDIDSDADRLTGRTGLITLSEGEHIVIMDAGVFCGCKDIESDSLNALTLLGILAMMLMTLLTGLYFVRQEEIRV